MQPFTTKILILAHEKEYKYVDELLRHLEVCLPEDVSIFSGDEILPDQSKADKLWQELNSSNVVLTIISSHYLADDLLYRLHQLAMELHDEKILEAIQIIARSVYNNTKTKRQVKSLPKIPLATAKNRDEAYSEIVEFVLDKIELIKTHYELLKEKLRVQALERKIKELLGE